MKIGYDHALKILLEEYKNLITKTDSDSQEKAKSIREGIEYLCYPFREDLSKFIRSPLRDENDPEQHFLKADLSTPEKQIAFNDRMAKMINKDIKLSAYAHEILSYLKNHQPHKKEK